MRRSVIALGLALAAGTTACGGLEFTNDNRLSFSAPEMDQLVTLPVTIRWSMQDFQPTGRDGETAKDKGVFAVFIDKEPIKVGGTLRSLVPGAEQQCGADPACPSEDALASIQVYVTQQPQITLTRVVPLLNTHTHRDRHEITVVLLDGTGKRLTESAWYRRFDLAKKVTP